MEEQTDNTKTKNGKCVYCGRYERYYTKGLYHFNRTKLGFCSRYDQIVGDIVCVKKRRQGLYMKF